MGSVIGKSNIDQQVQTSSISSKDLMYSIMPIINNIVLYAWMLHRVDFKRSYSKSCYMKYVLTLL